MFSSLGLVWRSRRSRAERATDFMKSLDQLRRASCTSDMNSIYVTSGFLLTKQTRLRLDRWKWFLFQ